ncbi:MAG: hypothetical protein J2P25_24485, partial [Nocardiopsaceae bacterium]|nr:hypothetical protein [Nocardiopsaceae bacterium]
ACLSVPLAIGAEAALRGLGGYVQQPLPGPLLSPAARLPGNAHMLWRVVMVLFGAYAPAGGGVVADGIAGFHWIGLVLALGGFAVAVVTCCAGPRGRADRVTQITVMATLAVMVAGIFGTELPDLSHAHEVAILAPLGAVLAGRALPPLLSAAWAAWSARHTGRLGLLGRLVPPVLLGAWLACGLAVLGYAGTGPQAPPRNQGLAEWLAARRLTYGLAGYWQAASVTVDSGGRVTVAPIVRGGRGATRWDSSVGWFDPAAHRATFIIAGDSGNELRPTTERRLFGPPAREYHAGSSVIMVYRYNLLTRVGGRAFPGPPFPPERSVHGLAD